MTSLHNILHKFITAETNRMAKVIIGIHGLGNKPKKSILENWWNEAIIEGLTKTGKPVPSFQFELVYWADILHEQPLDENCTDSKNPLCLVEKYIPSSGNLIHEDHSFRRKVLDFLSIEIDSIFLNEDYSMNYSVLTDAILKHWFNDLEIYYNEDSLVSKNLKAKENIRKRLTQIIEKYKDDELLIIGHSMGSIISYDVLAFQIPGIKINTFITIGSPLGVPVVKSKIAAERKLHHIVTRRLPAPPSVFRRWYNFSDLEDKVAYNYRLSDDFGINRHLVKPIDFIVNNDYEINGERNPHKSFGYLRSSEVSAKIIEFLKYTEPPKWKQLIHRFRSWKSYLKWISRTNRNPRHR